MKKIFVILIIAMIGLSAQAQKGAKQLNFGLGFDNNTIPVYGGFDYFLHKDISLGFEIGWRRYDTWNYNSKKYHQDLYSFNFPLNYHFATILAIEPKYDLYAGLNIGFLHWTDNVDYDEWNNDHTSGLALGLQIGFRYFFTDKFGVGVEFMGGRNVSNGKIGLSIRF